MDKGSKKEKLIVQAVCLLLSIGLWFYVANVENSIRSMTLEGIPVQLTDVEDLKASGLALAANQTFTVDLKIEGQSSDIYKVSKEQFILEANLGDYALKKGENRIPVTLVNYPSSINIKNTNVLNIKVNLDEYKEKVVTIESELSVTTAHGFYAGKPQLEKQELVVSGPGTQVEKVEKAVVRGITENVSTNISKNYNVIAIDKDGQEVKGVTLSETEVEVSVAVNKGKIVPIKVVTKGSLQDGKLKSITALTTEVELNGPEEVISKINEITTTAIDLSTITESKTMDVHLIVPDGVKIEGSNNIITVKIDIEFEQSISKEISVKVVTKGQKEEFNYAISPEEVKIIVHGYEDKLQNISASTFIAEIDLSNLSEGEHEIAPKVIVNGNLSINYEVQNTIKVTVSKI